MTVLQYPGVDISTIHMPSLKGMFGAVGDGIADDTAAMQSFADSALFGEVYVPPGTYRLTQVVFDLTILARKRIVCAPGVTFVKTTSAEMIVFRGAYDWTETVSSVGTASTALQDNTTDTGSEGSTTTYSNTLALGGARTVAKGDVLKVISDDVQIGARPGTTNRARKGEHCVVGLATSGTTITLTSILRDTYSTSVRVAKMNRTYFASIEGAIFDYDDTVSGSSSWTLPYVLWDTCAGATKNCRSLRAKWPCFRTLGVFEFDAENDNFQNGYNDGTHDQFGYGYDFRNSENIMVRNPRGSNLRHVVTSNPQEVPTGSSLINSYGHCWNVTVIGGHAVGCSNNAFDNHEDARDWRFIGCTSIGAYVGGRSNGGGFSARGQSTHFTSCRAINTRVGFWLTSYDDMIVSNCEAIGCTLSGVRVEQNGNGGSAYPITNCRIIGCTIENSTNSTSGAIVATGVDATNNVVLELVNTVVRCVGTTTTTKAIDLTYCNMRYSNITLDVSGYGGASGIYAIQLQNTSGCDVRGTGFRIAAGSYNALGGLVTSSSTSTHTGRLRGVYYDGVSDISGSFGGNVFNVVNNAAVQVSGEKNVNGSIKTTRFCAQTASASFTIRIGGSCDAGMTIEATGSAGAISAANWPDTVDPGFEVVFINNSNGTITFTEPSVAVAAGATIRRVRSESATSANKWKVSA